MPLRVFAMAIAPPSSVVSGRRGERISGCIHAELRGRGASSGTLDMSQVDIEKGAMMNGYESINETFKASWTWNATAGAARPA